MTNPVNSVKRRLVLRRLSQSHNDAIQTIAFAIREALSESLTREEQQLVLEIEKRRRSLEARDDLIRVKDYGAGLPESSRSVEEMLEGVEVTLRVGETCLRASKSYRWCLLLFKVIRTTKPVSCLELGTGLGISGAYQAAALALNGAGQLVTLEGSEELARIAEEVFRSLGHESFIKVVVGRFQANLHSILKSHRAIDYAFIDGHHDYRATLTYTEQILPCLAERAILVYDDIAWSDGMRRAWREIEADSRMAATFDMGSMGVCIVDRRMMKQLAVRLRMD